MTFEGQSDTTTCQVWPTFKVCIRKLTYNIRNWIEYKQQHIFFVKIDSPMEHGQILCPIAMLHVMSKKYQWEGR